MTSTRSARASATTPSASRRVAGHVGGQHAQAHAGRVVGARFGITRGAIATTSTAAHSAGDEREQERRSSSAATAISTASAATIGVNASSGTSGQPRSSPRMRITVQATSTPASPQRRPRSSIAAHDGGPPRGARR